MAKQCNKAAAASKDGGTWSTLQLIACMLFGALAAIALSPRYPSLATVVKQETAQPNSSAAEPHAIPTTIDASKVKVLSFDPFIAHIADFVSPSERAHLLNLGIPLLKSSVILDDAGNKVSSSGRTSSTAFLPEDDPIVHTIALRAADFQGYLSPADIDVQITAYQPGQQYKPHYDWYPSPRPKNRVSTFFAILKSTCEDCGTEFPFFNTSQRGSFDKRWCDVIDCSKEVLTTRNVEGSALFWVNLDGEGEGRLDMLHAGLPARNGEKVGLNVWTDVDLKEVKRRGMFGGQSRHFFRPTEEFLESHGLLREGEGE